MSKTTKQNTKEKSGLAIKVKTVEELRNTINELSTGFDARYVLERADKELKKMKMGDPFGPETNLYKSMTLFEFDKGILMASSISDRYRIFVLEFSKNLQSEYSCTTPSEKSLTEIIAVNFVRVLEAQNRINSYLSKDSVSDSGIGYLNVMSKELDRAERHYLTSLQALKMLKLPALEVNIKTQTAVVGQNQLIQSNNNDKGL